MTVFFLFFLNFVHTQVVLSEHFTSIRGYFTDLNVVTKKKQILSSFSNVSLHTTAKSFPQLLMQRVPMVLLISVVV